MTTTQAPPLRAGSAADTLYRYLAKGRRTDYQMAESRWGIRRGTYHQAILRLARHLDIDTDRKAVKMKLATGATRTRYIASHQLVR